MRISVITLAVVCAIVVCGVSAQRGGRGGRRGPGGPPGGEGGRRGGEGGRRPGRGGPGGRGGRRGPPPPPDYTWDRDFAGTGADPLVQESVRVVEKSDDATGEPIGTAMFLHTRVSPFDAEAKNINGSLTAYFFPASGAAAKMATRPGRMGPCVIQDTTETVAKLTTLFSQRNMSDAAVTANNLEEVMELSGMERMTEEEQTANPALGRFCRGRKATVTPLPTGVPAPVPEGKNVIYLSTVTGKMALVVPERRRRGPGGRPGRGGIRNVIFGSKTFESKPPQ